MSTLLRSLTSCASPGPQLGVLRGINTTLGLCISEDTGLPLPPRSRPGTPYPMTKATYDYHNVEGVWVSPCHSNPQHMPQLWHVSRSERCSSTNMYTGTCTCRWLRVDPQQSHWRLERKRVDNDLSTAIYGHDFYPRDVVSGVYATATWLGGWLAGCLSVTRRYCIKTAKPILKLFQPFGSTIILVPSDPCDTDLKILHTTCMTVNFYLKLLIHEKSSILRGCSSLTY